MMFQFRFPNSGAVFSICRTNCPDVSHFSQMRSHLPRSPPPAPDLYSAVTHPFLGYVLTQTTPKPNPKNTFSWPELESGQNELQSGQFGPQLGKIFEKWAKLSRSGQKKFI